MNITKNLVKESYELYKPKVDYSIIHKAKISKGHFGYNHDVSIEWFNGLFYAAWNAHGATHIEGDAGQINVLSTSVDFKNWSTPIDFLGQSAHNPISCPDGVMWQPNLLNYKNEELWCLWCICHPVAKAEKLKHSGTYLSKLSNEPDAKWENKLIIDRHCIDGVETIGFPTQNPFICSSGRVVAPVVFIDSSAQVGGDDRTNRRWNACVYSDDGGNTWDISNPISQCGDYSAQWEPHFYEQYDGRIRCIMRNMTSATPSCQHWHLTCLGSSSEKGVELRFDEEPQFSYIETANTRSHVIRLISGHYCMFHHDVFLANRVGVWQWEAHRDYHSRLNISLFFSRSGSDDFVAALPLSRKNIISTYPQGLEHKGKIYVAYTTGKGDECRSIEGAIVEYSPEKNKNYIFPRKKEYVKMASEMKHDGKRNTYRSNPDDDIAQVRKVDIDGQDCLFFPERSSASVDIEPVDLGDKQTLSLDFRFMLRQAPKKGYLVLCSLGDVYPVRIAIPSNRESDVYAFGRKQWQRVGKFDNRHWNNISIVFGKFGFKIALNDCGYVCFENMVVAPNSRLYFGDGFESEHLPNNIDGSFYIDLKSVSTFVNNDSTEI